MTDQITLNDVLTELGVPPAENDRTLTHLTLDSRTIVGGELFIAMPGVQSDGRQYITNALANGATAVLVDDSEGFDLASVVQLASVFIVPGLKNKVGSLAHCFYHRPSGRLKVMGVTGTNGKTSCCWFMAQVLQRLGEPCALMGTVGRGLPGKLQASLNTTGDVVSLHRYLAQLVAEQVPVLAMEVSSHGLDQGRVNGVVFQVALFTHISRDHLDYHGTLAEYAAAKARLFSACQYRHAVIGKDDAYADLMFSSCPPGTDITAWSLEDTSADVYLSNITVLPQGFRATIHTPWGEGELNTALLGRFNLENLLAVIAALGVQGYPLAQVLATIPEISPPPGRMQQCGGDGQPLVLVDYAHTPDAISSVLSALREHSQGDGRVVCVYGCGGDRDRGKRPLMTAAALAGADTVVLTCDNPRTEDPEQIFADALAEVNDADRQRIQVIADRSAAIRAAISEAGTEDMVVIAGKGHENYQEINGVRHHFDDVEQVQSVLQLLQTNDEDGNAVVVTPVNVQDGRLA